MLKIAGVSAGNIINSLLAFVFLAVAAKYLPIEQFGQYAILTSILLVSSKLADFGSNSIFVTRAIADSRKDTLSDSFHTLKIVMFILTAIPMSVALILFSHAGLPLILISIAGLAGYTINLTLFAHFQKEEMYVPLILLNTIPALTKVGAALLIISGVVQGTLFNIYSVFSLSILLDLFLIPFLPKNSGVFKFNFMSLREILSAGMPQGISQVMQESWPALNNVITKVVYGFSDVGIFSMANKISNIFTLLSLSIFTVLLPQNAKKKKQNIRYDINETVLISLGILILSVLAIGVAKIFLDVFFGDKFSGSLRVLDILILASAFAAISTFMENYFIVHNVTHYIMIISIVKLVFFLSSCRVLIPVYGLNGLAYSNLISMVISLGVTSYYVKKSF